MTQAKTNNEYILHSFNEYLIQGHYFLDAGDIYKEIQNRVSDL